MTIHCTFCGLLCAGAIYRTVVEPNRIITDRSGRPRLIPHFLIICHDCSANVSMSESQRRYDAWIAGRIPDPELVIAKLKRCSVCDDLVFGHGGDIVMHLEHDPKAENLPDLCGVCCLKRRL